MALFKTLELVDNFNVTVNIQNAYIKVVTVNGNKDLLFANVTAYKEKDGQTLTNKSYEFTPDLAGRNFFAQAYEYLKTLPEFSNATDC